ncbi:MAG TPA: sulfatase-like hydrolase/transferase [Gemmatimonadales bacterium]|nr:sulfatase-like hydrolase/transferase [Gemmatimonadales bacterium]
MRRFNIVPYPFLFALYSVLAIASANATELIPLHDLLRPLLLATAIADAAYLVALSAGPDPHRRAAGAGFAVLVCVTFWFWGDLFAWRQEVAGEVAAVVCAALLIIVLNLFLRRSRRTFAGVSRYLNLFGGILLFWSGGTLAWRHLHHVSVAVAQPLPVRSAPVRGVDPDSSQRELPHVVVVILDKYTGAKSLRANFGFDDTPFEDGLRRRGFFVPGNAHANYVQTFLALSAMLNWDYLDAQTKALGPDSHCWECFYPVLEDNRTWHALKDRGYEFVFLPTGLPATASNRYADLELPSSRAITHEFEAAWVRTTILLPLMEAACASIRCSDAALPYAPESAASLDWKFEQIPLLLRQQRPVYVFAHFTVPHEPYVYDAECRHRRPSWPERDDGPDSLQIKADYVDQIRCVNRKVDRLVDAMAANSSRPLVVMLQADHGHGRMGRDQPSLSNAPPDRVAERLDIFAAYRFPGAPAGLVYDSISPINAMRALMRFYFQLDLPPLEDASYWSSADLPYKFARVR